MKKGIVLLVVFALLINIFAGCNSTTDSAGSTAANEAGEANETNETVDTGDLPNLVMMFPYMEIPSDLKLVENALNEILVEKAGCTVELVGSTYGNIGDQMTLTLSSPSEQLDLLMGRFFGTGLTGYVSKGQIRPLNDLLDQYGQGIKDNIDPHSFEACTINGEVYSILTNRDLATSRGIVFFKDDIDSLNIELPEYFSSFDEITEVFAQLHEAYPEKYVFATSAPKSSPFVGITGKVDELSDYLGVLMDLDELTVTNLYESELYREFCLTMKEWNDAGYIYDDILIDSSNSGPNLMKAGTMLTCMNVAKPGAEVENSALIGGDAYVVMMGHQTRATNQNWSWVIPQNAVYPEKAMEVINILFTDEDAINTLCYGVKGVHWEFDADGFVADGPESAGYPDKKNWATGNGYIAGVRVGDDIDLGDQLMDYNNNANISAALGFTFDSSDLTGEYTALQNVLSEHQLMLEFGFVDDVDTALETFNAALYAAGLQEYIDAKQAQLDAWAAA